MKIFVLDDYEEQIIRLVIADNLIVSLDSFLSGTPSQLFINQIIRYLKQVDYIQNAKRISAR